MPGRHTSRVLIDRAAELAALVAAVDTCVADDRCVVLVTGDAGIGKTRLLRELAGRVRAQSPASAVAWGTCLPPGDVDIPFSPVSALLLGLVAGQADPSVDGAVARARRELVGDDEIEASGVQVDDLRARAAGQAAGRSRLRIFEAVLDAVHAAIRDIGPEGRLVLVVDDAHWADPATLDLLAFLARRLGRTRAVLLVACREDRGPGGTLVGAFVRDIERDWLLERVDLRPLDPGGVRRLASAIDPAGRHDVALVAARSQGNPFLVEELLRLPPESRQVPESVRELLRERLDGLPEAARGVVNASAVVGRPATPRLLGAVAGLDEADAAGATDRAVEAGILVEAANGVDIRHSLLREAALERLPARERERLHGAAATALERDAGGRAPLPVLVEIASHRDLSGDSARALPALVGAADAAAAAFAWTSAATAYERAGELVLAASGPTGEAARLAYRAGEMWSDANELQRAMTQMRRAARIAGRARLQDARIHAWTNVVRLHDDIGDADRARRLVGRIHSRWQAEVTPATRVRLDLIAAAMPILAGSLEAGVPLAAAALDEARRRGMPTEIAEAASLLAIAAACSGDRARFEELTRIATEVQPLASIEGVDVVVVNRAAQELALGSWGAADRALAAGRRVAMGYGIDHAPAVLGYVRAIETELELQQGHLRAALQASSSPDGPQPGVHPHHALAGFEACAAALAGERERAASAIEAGWARTAWCRWHRAILETARALLRLADGEAMAALDAAESALRYLAMDVSVSDPARVRLVALRAAADAAVEARARRDRAAAEALVHRVLPLTRWFEGLARGDAGPGRIVVPVNAARGRLGVAEARRLAGHADPAAWRAAAAELGETGLHWDEAYARFRLAESLLLGAGARDQALGQLTDAVAYARREGAAPLLEAIEALARRARLSLPAQLVATPPAGSDAVPPRDNPWDLTSRELEVLALLAEGRTNREIGDRLFVTSKTASSHVTHILDKMGVGSRVEAALLGARLAPGAGS